MKTEEQAATFEQPTTETRVRKHKPSACRRSASFSEREIRVAQALFAKAPSIPALHKIVCEDGFSSTWCKFSTMLESFGKEGGQ